jgi:hypothetical protein
LINVLDLPPPSITHFDPPRGQPGCVITVHGSGFSPVRLDNEVRIDGYECFVVSASPNELRAIVPRELEGGEVEVSTPKGNTIGPHGYIVTRHPSPGEDGPPILFEGTGTGYSGNVNPLGTVRVLVVPVRPNDTSPADPDAVRTKIAEEWTKAKEYYRQVSYGRTTIQFDILDSWTLLDGSLEDFTKYDNFDTDKWIRLVAQAAQAAKDKGIELNDYQVLATTMFANGKQLRGYGGGYRQLFDYGTIHIPLQKPINEILVDEAAGWGRLAHEFGHNVVSEPAFSGHSTKMLKAGDIYGEGPNPHSASAKRFDLMGSHEEHPLFSGFHMENLGYYKPDNVLELSWDRNPFKQEFELVAHGLSEDTASDRLHLVKIKVAAGLSYYVEVRQRPATAAQMFDGDIPLPYEGSPNQGGVVVTSVISGTFHMNQQTRFITTLQDPTVLAAPTALPEPVALPKGSTVEDPVRKLRITVVDDDVQAQPLVCRVRVEWATIADDPKGAFDLQVEPWDSGYQTPDLWIDRIPFGVFDNPLDSLKRPIGNGDRPWVWELNHVHARVRVSGALGAKDVRVTYYTVTPPGVGDNGNWAPLGTRSIAEIPPNGEADAPPVDWAPAIDQHTCLMVAVSPQPGEIASGNNFAQENIATFVAASKSPIEPVISRTAIRNPLDERRLVHIGVHGVPEGWRVQFPHSWVWLEGKAEKQFDLIVMPFRDYWEYEKGELCKNVEIKVHGHLTYDYVKPSASGDTPPPSRLYPIGGVLNDVRVRRNAEIELWDDGGDEWTIELYGRIDPPFPDQRVLVVLLDPVGGRRIREVRTGGEGEFRASFDLRFAPSGEADPELWEKANTLERGTYRARAEIFAASQAADAVSGFVFVER